MTLLSSIARSLEEGRSGSASRVMAAAWGEIASRSLVKALHAHEGTKLVAIGGSTLGGSGKTPLAIACARALAEAEESVAVVGHGYGGRLTSPRIVNVDDSVSLVGDEALMTARALARSPAKVVVGPTRQSAIDLALRFADTVVLDGVAQTRPKRASLALLAIDGTKPWGAGACPPAGDLRAPSKALLALCDQVVTIGEDAEVSATGARLGDVKLSWPELQQRRIGLWTSIARPERVRALLLTKGITPVYVVAHGDHAEVPSRERAKHVREGRARGVDLWLCTPKCKVSLPSLLDEEPLAVLDYELHLSDALRRRLTQLLPATSGA